MYVKNLNDLRDLNFSALAELLKNLKFQFDQLDEQCTFFIFLDLYFKIKFIDSLIEVFNECFLNYRKFKHGIFNKYIQYLINNNQEKTQIIDFFYQFEKEFNSAPTSENNFIFEILSNKTFKNKFKFIFKHFSGNLSPSIKMPDYVNWDISEILVYAFLAQINSNQFSKSIFKNNKIDLDKIPHNNFFELI